MKSYSRVVMKSYRGMWDALFILVLRGGGANCPPQLKGATNNLSPHLFSVKILIISGI